MTQNRKFRQHVRLLAAERGLSYAEALKLANSNETGTSFSPTLDEAHTFRLGKILPTPVESIAPEVSEFVTGGIGQGKSNQYAQWSLPNEPHLRITGHPGTGKTIFAQKLVRGATGKIKTAVISSRPDEWEGIASTVGHVNDAKETIDRVLANREPIDYSYLGAHEPLLLVVDTPSLDDLDVVSKSLIQITLRVGRSWHCHLVLVGAASENPEVAKEIELTTQPLVTQLELETNWIADFKGDRFKL